MKEKEKKKEKEDLSNIKKDDVVGRKRNGKKGTNDMNIDVSIYIVVERI
jgi:hypothetical protein